MFTLTQSGGRACVGESRYAARPEFIPVTQFRAPRSRVCLGPSRLRVGGSAKDAGMPFGTGTGPGIRRVEKPIGVGPVLGAVQSFGALLHNPSVARLCVIDRQRDVSENDPICGGNCRFPVASPKRPGTRPPPTNLEGQSVGSAIKFHASSWIRSTGQQSNYAFVAL